MKMKVFLFSIFLWISATGCAQLSDPWGLSGQVPASPSRAYISDSYHSKADRSSSLPNSIQPGQELTLARCVGIALERNPRTAGTWHAARAAAARSGQSRSAYLPSVEFTSSAGRGNPNELDNTTDRGTQNTFESVFSIKYLLYDGGKREAGVREADADLLAASFRHNATLQQVTFDVAEAYYDLLGAQSMETLANETLYQRGYHVRLAEARYEAGIVPKSDVLKARTEEADAELGLVQAENAVRVARGRLAASMGLRVSLQFEIVDLPDEFIEREPSDIEALIDEAARNRPELRSALAQVESRRAALESARAKRWPSISFNSNLGWSERSFPPYDDQWNAGISLEIPLFSGFDRTYDIQKARAELEKKVAEHRDLLSGVELEVWNAYSLIIEAGRAIDAARRFVASAEESARLAEGEYKNGTGSIIGLIDAQKAQSAAQTRLIQAKLDYRTAVARFERAVGRSFIGEADK